MRVRPIPAVLWCLALGAGVVGWVWGWREQRQLTRMEFTRQRLGFLEVETHRLSGLIEAKQRAEEQAAAAAQRTAIEHDVANLRGLPFLRKVSYREIPRSQLPEILQQKLAQQVNDQELGGSAVALAALGLLPGGVDLKKTYLALLREQVGAFYDQHSQELFTFSGQSLNNTQNRVILAHELTHALEDQQFNLSRLPLEAKGNDDRALAASALVEGDATLVMNRYMVDNLSAAVLRDSLTGALTTDVRQLAAAPRYMRETLLFPYLHGLAFCQVLYDRGGWGALATAFQHPPVSTSVILHPDRFSDSSGKVPADTLFSQTAVLGQTPVYDNVLGEFGTRQLLAAWTKDLEFATSAADGWNGDRYLVYGNRAVSSYVWRTRWVDQPSAQRFRGAMLRCFSLRYSGAVPQTMGEGGATITTLEAGTDHGRRLMLANTGPNEILVIDAQDARWLAALQTLNPVSSSNP